MKKLRESITHYTLSTPRKRTKHLWAQYSSVARRSPIRNRLSLTTTQINNVLILKVNYWTRMQRRKRQADTDSFKIKNSGGKKTGTRHGWEMVGETDEGGKLGTTSDIEDLNSLKSSFWNVNILSENVRRLRLISANFTGKNVVKFCTTSTLQKFISRERRF